MTEIAAKTRSSSAGLRDAKTRPRMLLNALMGGGEADLSGSSAAHKEDAKISDMMRRIATKDGPAIKQKYKLDIHVGCWRCKKLPAGAMPLQKCSRCHTAAYCNRDCQEAHWREHKSQCAKIVDVQGGPEEKAVQRANRRRLKALDAWLEEANLSGQLVVAARHAQLDLCTAEDRRSRVLRIELMCSRTRDDDAFEIYSVGILPFARGIFADPGISCDPIAIDKVRSYLHSDGAEDHVLVFAFCPRLGEKGDLYVFRPIKVIKAFFADQHEDEICRFHTADLAWLLRELAQQPASASSTEERHCPVPQSIVRPYVPLRILCAWRHLCLLQLRAVAIFAIRDAESTCQGISSSYVVDVGVERDETDPVDLLNCLRVRCFEVNKIADLREQTQPVHLSRIELQRRAALLNSVDSLSQGKPAQVFVRISYLGASIFFELDIDLAVPRPLLMEPRPYSEQRYIEWLNLSMPRSSRLAADGL